MAKVRVDVDYTIADGAEILFYAPGDFSDITSLVVYYPDEDDDMVFQEFIFKDAHNNDLTDLDHLFATGACVKVILNVSTSRAFIQNADTNKYLEDRFAEINQSILEIKELYAELKTLIESGVVGRLGSFTLGKSKLG